jgi:hypothetical protein
MITNDYIKGYITALKTVEENADHLIASYKSVQSSRYEEHSEIALEALYNVKSHIKQLKESYKDLVQRLNNGQKKE